jgi:hypothetical protein
VCNGVDVLADPERLWQAVQAGDPRFDGWVFCGVTSTASSRRRLVLRLPAFEPASAAAPTRRQVRLSGTAEPTSSVGPCG